LVSEGISTKTIVQQLFHGKMMVVCRCLHCGLESHVVEPFANIPLAFPNQLDPFVKEKLNGSETRGLSNGQQKKLSIADSRSSLHLNDMVHYFLRKELLDGNNQYACSRCASLQNGEREVKFVQLPEFAIITLLRFAYDPQSQLRSKIYTDVQFPQEISLPAFAYNTHCKNSEARIHHETYVLVAVTFHSGLSLDSGHYYSYARSLSVTHSASDDDWFMFNDSRVSPTQYTTFSRTTQQFCHDTPYILIYRKAECTLHIPSEVPLSSDLLQQIKEDNKQFLLVIFLLIC
jgi:ubiquitin carboxyl-terminal hydrolase 35/38